MQVFATDSLTDADEVDIVLVPGGMGTRALVHDADFLNDVSRWARGATVIASVCTGSAVLAAAGLLDGYRATSNKRAFEWAAGMDITVALIEIFHGSEIAEQVAVEIEYEPHKDANWDPYARHYGLA